MPKPTTIVEVVHQPYRDSATPEALAAMGAPAFGDPPPAQRQEPLFKLSDQQRKDLRGVQGVLTILLLVSYLIGVWFAFYGAWREAAFLAVALLLPLGIVLAWTLWIRHRGKRGY